MKISVSAIYEFLCTRVTFLVENFKQIRFEFSKLTFLQILCPSLAKDIGEVIFNDFVELVWHEPNALFRVDIANPA